MVSDNYFVASMFFTAVGAVGVFMGVLFILKDTFEGVL